MKKLITWFFLAGIPLLVKADGITNIRVQVLFETTGGKKIPAWILQPAESESEIDSFSFPGYIKKKLFETYGQEDDIMYFKNRICYEFDTWSWEGQRVRAKTCTEIDMGSIKRGDIKELEVIRIIDYRDEDNTETLTGRYMENELRASDTLWMKKPPLRSVLIRGNVCDFEIFIHEENKKIGVILDSMRKIAEKGSMDPGIDKDTELYQIVQKIRGLKVVVLVPSCSC